MYKIIISCFLSASLIALFWLFLTVFSGLKDELNIAQETINNLPKKTVQGELLKNGK